MPHTLNHTPVAVNWVLVVGLRSYTRPQCSLLPVCVPPLEIQKELLELLSGIDSKMQQSAIPEAKTKLVRDER